MENFYVDVNVHLTTRIPSHNIVTTKLVPQDRWKDPLEPPRGVVVAAFMQHVVLYFRSYMRPLNYLKYKKTLIQMFVYLFKSIIKAKSNEETTNLFNFTLKDNASNWCNNYMRNRPNYKF